MTFIGSGIMTAGSMGLRDREYAKFGQANQPAEQSGAVVVLGGGIYFSGQQTYTHQDVVPFSFDSKGRLETSMSGAEIHIGSVSANVDAVYIQSGDLLTGSMRAVNDVNSPLYVAGSIHVTSGTSYVDVTTGSIRVLNDVNSVLYTAGSIHVTSGTSYVNVPAAYIQSGDNLEVYGSHAISAAITVPPVLVGQRAESTVPTEVSDGDMVAGWHDTFGRQIIKGTNLGQEALDVSEVAPALTQTINTVNLNAVGSAAGSHVGAWVNMSDYGNKTFYLNYASGAVGSMIVAHDASPDAGSTVWELGSHVYDEDNTKDTIVIADHHEFMRTRTEKNVGGTLTVTITGRGGR